MSTQKWTQDRLHQKGPVKLCSPGALCKKSVWANPPTCRSVRDGKQGSNWKRGGRETCSWQKIFTAIKEGVTALQSRTLPGDPLFPRSQSFWWTPLPHHPESLSTSFFPSSFPLSLPRFLKVTPSWYPQFYFLLPQASYFLSGPSIPLSLSLPTVKEVGVKCWWYVFFTFKWKSLVFINFFNS